MRARGSSEVEQPPASTFTVVGMNVFLYTKSPGTASVIIKVLAASDKRIHGYTFFMQFCPNVWHFCTSGHCILANVKKKSDDDS